MVCGQVLMTTTVLSAYLRMVTDDHLFFRTVQLCLVFSVWNHASELLRHHLYSPGQSARLFIRGTSYVCVSAKDLRRFQ